MFDFVNIQDYKLIIHATGFGAIQARCLFY